MPWHWAHKIVPYWDLETRQQVVPSEPNAYKAERFLFDILPFAKRAQVIATRREEEFAPVKNLQGSDSVDSSRRAISEKARNWLRESGLMSSHTESNSKIIVEISPLLATCPGDLREQLPTFPSPTGPQILLEPPAE
jgi:UDP-N-acetylglucosamine/UDP-N-acetylgalactosamine diphosphorylase